MREGFGLGLGVLRISGYTTFISSTTPIDEENVKVRWIFTSPAAGGPDAAREAAVNFSTGVSQDLPIWENKRYVERPVVTKSEKKLLEQRSGHGSSIRTTTPEPRLGLTTEERWMAVGQYCFYVTDLERCIAFYELLGLDCTSRTDIPGHAEAITENPNQGSKRQLAQQVDNDASIDMGPSMWKLYAHTDARALDEKAVAPGTTHSSSPCPPSDGR